MTSDWFLYIVECSDGTLYTGITNDLEQRIQKHNTGKGAKYTRSRCPVVLKFFWKYDNKSEALKAEYACKRLRRDEKLNLIKRRCKPTI